MLTLKFALPPNNLKQTDETDAKCCYLNGSWFNDFISLPRRCYAISMDTNNTSIESDSSRVCMLDNYNSVVSELPRLKQAAAICCDLEI